VGAFEPSSQGCPGHAVAVHHHRDDAPPHEGVEAVEGVFGHRMPEIVGPSALDLVDPGQHARQRAVAALERVVPWVIEIGGQELHHIGRVVVLVEALIPVTLANQIPCAGRQRLLHQVGNGQIN
jgi:hypothetical protein